MRLKLPLSFVLASIVAAVMSATAVAQLQITEVMFNTASNESRWEWVEIRNTNAMPFDLNGGYYYDDDLNDLPAPNIDNSMTPNTVIRANGVAVIFNGGALDEARFRSAWNLPASVRLIGASPTPALSNSGDAIGIWGDTASYQADLGDGDMDGDLEIVQFVNSLANLDYSTFPSGSNGVSIYWTGTGSYQDGAANWDTSDNDMNATVSLMTTINAQLNSTDDIGNPGSVTSTGTGPSALLITEIMSNPASSPEAGWEWVEVFNNTGVAIDFSATPFYFDDDDGSDLAMPNVNMGVIGDGESAILFSDDITAQNFADAWGAGNHLPIDFGNGLSNAGDTIGLWDNATDYTNDRAAGGIPTGAESFVPLGDASWTIGTGDGQGSLTLVDRTDPTSDANWAVSADGDGVSFFASPAVDITTDHEGGDVGSPGSFGSGSVVDGDFNDDGVYGCIDVDGLVAEIAAGTNNLAFDMTGDNVVNQDDLVAWRAEAGDIGGLTASGNPIQEGDATLDGTVDGQDFIAWNGSKFTATPEWCSGDFNADGTVDGQDFILWNANKFTSADHGVAVPEPANGLMLLVLLFGLVPSCRR